MRFRRLAVLLLFILVAIGLAAGYFASQKSKFTISKETTFVTAPIDTDGYIDYADALNDRLREGVTPENNANVLLWKALGPRPEGAAVAAELFEQLGIEAPPEKGDYFIKFHQFQKEHFKTTPEQPPTEFEQALDATAKRPWKPDQFPEIAAWLNANAKPLLVVIEATKRPQYYSPLVPQRTEEGRGDLLGCLLPSVQSCRDVANALARRAMLHLGQGEVDAAWQDLLACHRLGRLVGRGGTLIEGLVGLSIDGVAYSADLAFLESAQGDEKQLTKAVRDLRQLPAVPSMAAKVNLAERFMFLDVLLRVDRGGLPYLESLSNGKGSDSSTHLANFLLFGIDWDPAMRSAHLWFDRVAAVLNEKNRPKGRAKWKEVEDDLKQLKHDSIEVREKGWSLLFDGKVKGQAVGDILLCLMLPAIDKVQDAVDRVEQTHRNTGVAFALVAYRHDHTRYPETLEALAPKHLAEIPDDLFSGKPLIYRATENGYLLYSVGLNGKDDEGRGREDEPPGDDLAIRMPLPPLPEK